MEKSVGQEVSLGSQDPALTGSERTEKSPISSIHVDSMLGQDVSSLLALRRHTMMGFVCIVKCV